MSGRETTVKIVTIPLSKKFLEIFAPIRVAFAFRFVLNITKGRDKIAASPRSTVERD